MGGDGQEIVRRVRIGVVYWEERDLRSCQRHFEVETSPLRTSMSSTVVERLGTRIDWKFSPSFKVISLNEE